jgi:hypothetical protein
MLSGVKAVNGPTHHPRGLPNICQIHSSRLSSGSVEARRPGAVQSRQNHKPAPRSVVFRCARTAVTERET